MTFWTLLGADYSGKSAILSALSTEDGWRAVSYDDRYVADDFPAVGRLRRDWLAEVFPGARHRYSPEFVMTLLHAIVLHLRDEVMHHSGTDNVIVDSYYYKLLAKCQLSGLAHQPTFATWRSFPQPKQVLYLDVTAEQAWERANQGADLNLFEHYGTTPTWRDFARYQADLRSEMIREVGHLPVVRIDTNADAATVLARVRGALRDGGTVLSDGNRLTAGNHLSTEDHLTTAPAGGHR